MSNILVAIFRQVKCSSITSNYLANFSRRHKQNPLKIDSWFSTISFPNLPPHSPILPSVKLLQPRIPSMGPHSIRSGTVPRRSPARCSRFSKKILRNGRAEQCKEVRWFPDGERSWVSGGEMVFQERRWVHLVRVGLGLRHGVLGRTDTK